MMVIHLDWLVLYQGAAWDKWSYGESSEIESLGTLAASVPILPDLDRQENGTLVA